MASNVKRPKRKTILNTDPVLGGYLRGNTLKIVVRNYNPARPDFPATPTPLRLHQRRPQGTVTRRNVSGNPAFSPEFSQYLETIADKQHRRTLEYTMKHWWTAPWVEPELRANFPEAAVNLLIAVVINGVTLTTAIRMTDYTMAEWQRYERKMRAYCQDRIKELARRAARA